MASLREQVRSTMYGAISATMNKPVEELTDETQLIADLGAKSVNLVRIIGVLEDEFDVEINFMAFRRNKTFGDAADFVAELVGE